MPQHLRYPTNVTARIAQHYTRGTTQPGRHLEMDGICLGLSLSWLRRMACGRPLGEFPSHMEGMFGQYAYLTGNNSRLLSQWMIEGPTALLGLDQYCFRVGFRHTVNRRCTLQECMALIRETDSPDDASRKTFLVLADGHATGLTIAGAKVALFDSNIGIDVFDRRNHDDLHALEGTLRKLAPIHRSYLLTGLAY